MSKVSEALRLTCARGAVQHFTGVDREGLPEISELMAGVVGKSGVEWERHPHSLLLFCEGPSIKWKFGSGDDRPSVWGTSDSLRDIMLAIEDDLGKGRFGTKPPTKDNNGFTHGRR